MNLTLEQAIIIKIWRCGKLPHSWRRIAEKAYQEWGEQVGSKDGNQMVGYELCEKAAELLGENQFEGSWEL